MPASRDSRRFHLKCGTPYMSYILEALRKSERERQTGQAPSLPSLLSDPPRRSRPWLAWLALGLLLFNACGLIYVWLNGWGRSPVSAQPTGSMPEPSRPETPAAPSTPHRSAASRDAAPSTALVFENPPEPVAEPGIPAVAKSPSSRSEPSSRMKSAETGNPSAVRPKAVGSSKPKMAPAPPLAKADALAKNEEVENPTPESDASETVERLAAIRPPAPASPSPLPDTEIPEAAPSAGRNDIPWLRDLPAEFRDRMPPFKINVYAYSKSPAERFAIIDMSKYLAGDRIPGGALLLEIRADSLIFELDGTKFRVPRP